MDKKPSFQFYPGDWLKDPKLSMCSAVTRGIWVDVICAMHELGRSGILAGTPTQLVRPLRCTAAELRYAITELKATKTADITEHNGIVTLVCRRMQREAKVRSNATSRQQKSRRHATDTFLSQDSSSLSSSSSSSSDKISNPKKDPLAQNRFEQFWQIYPKKLAKKDAIKA